MAGPFDAYFEDLKKQEASRTAAQVRLNPMNPDQMAGDMATAKELGVKPVEVTAFPELFKDRLAQQRATTALTGAPKMSDWLRSDPANAALSKDDLDNLAWWEKGLNDFAGMGGMFSEPTAGALKRGGIGKKQDYLQWQAVQAQGRSLDRDLTFGQIVEDAKPKLYGPDGSVTDVATLGPGGAVEALYRYTASRASMLMGVDDQKAAVDFQVAAENARRQIAAIPMSPGAAKIRDAIGGIDGTASTLDQVRQFADIVSAEPSSFLAFMGQVAAESLPSLAAATATTAITRNPTAGAVVLGGASGAREWGATVGDELAASGHDLSTPEGAAAALNDPALLAEATRKGNARGLVIGVLDGLSGGVAGKTLLKSPVGNALAQTLTQMVIAGAGEAGGQLAADGRISSVPDILVEALADAVTAPIEIGGVAGRGFLSDSSAAAHAGTAAAMLDEASAQAQASKVKARSPDTFKAALESAGVGDNMVYVPAQGLREFFQARDLSFDAEMAAAWGIDPDTMAEMEISGGRVAVPMSNFAAHLAGTDAEAWIRENATISPDEMSLADAKAYHDLVPEDSEAAYEQVMADLRSDDAARSSEQQVFDGAYSQLRAAGRTSEVADKEARVLSSYFAAMAERTGEDALDLSRRFGLEIHGPDDAAIPRRRGALDVMLNDLRAGRKEKIGRNLTQFIIDSGGVQDVGGDVAALEGPRGLVAETAGEYAARRSQPVMPGMMPSQGKGLPLDELGRMAVEAGYFPELMGEVQGLNDGVAADLGASLLRALQDEAGGQARYPDGEGPDPARAALNAELQRRAIDPAAMSNDEIAASLESDPGATEYGQAAVPEGASRMWQHGLQRVLNGAAKAIDMLSMGRPGAVLRALGLSNAPLTMNAGKLRKVMQDHPEVTPAVAEQLVNGLNDPEFVLRSATEDDSIVVVPVQLDDGRVFVVPIKVNATDRQGRAINLIASAYIKDDAAWIEREVAAGRLIYARDMESAAVRANVAGSNPRRGQPNSTGRNQPRKAKILTRADVFKPNEFSQTRRGSIQFAPGGPLDATTIINLFEAADLSTFMHESAHFFLEATNALAMEDSAPQALRDDMAAVRDYLGAEEGKPFTTDQHETFARSFEAYLLEGKAPSLALADVFARMKAWLTRIYRSVAGLDVKLTPEIREVFDRMLASDTEIAQARAETSASALFREKPPGMSDADWSTYQRMARRSKEQAEAKLLDKTMEKVRREKEAWWKAERKQVKAEVEARFNDLPQYRLIEAMANGRFLLDEGERAAPDIRISRKDLVQQFGAGILGEISRERFGGKRAIYADEGLSPQVVADMFGFAGAAEMIGILQNARKRLDAINTETDQIMLDRYGDPMTDGTIEQEAMDAIHNSQQEQKNVAEARHMAARLGRDTKRMTSALYRQRARLMLGRMTVREAAAPARFLAAERRAGREAERSFAKVVRGDASALSAALQAKEQQILNAALYDLSREAEAEIGKAREKMQGYGKKAVREKLAGGYIEQIDDLLDRYDFRRRAPGQVAKAERLRDFIDRMKAEGREAELMIDPRMEDDARRVHYSRLSLDEFRGLLDTVENIDHLGRFKQKLIDRKKRRDLLETAEGVAKAIADNIGTGKIKQESRGRYLLDLILTADTVLVDMDGGDEFGHSYQSIKEDIDAGYVRVDEMNRELTEKLDQVFSVYSAKDMRAMKAEKHINGTSFVWSKWKAISVALNTGNGDNIARLLSSEAHADQRMSQTDMDAVLDTLDKRDWDFVQSMWDLIDSYWSEIDAVTVRRTGVKPGKVEAQQVDTKFGAYRGGYYPIKYDAGYGHAAAVDARTDLDGFMSAGRFAKAQTKHGHTIERKANGNGRTLNLDLDVAFTHLRDVIRDIALSEAVDNSYRVMNHPVVAQAFMDAGRKNDIDMMNLWLKDVAQGPIVHSDVLSMTARIVKNNFTLSRLALNLKTAALQMTGSAQSAAVVGKGLMARAMSDYLRHPARNSREVMAKSEFMRRRQTTFNKDINDFANDAKIAGPLAGRVSQVSQFMGKVGFAPLTKVQFYAVDVPTWMAGYRRGLRQFPGDEGKAIAFADRIVARAQDNGAMPDRSAISRGTIAENARQVEWIKLFTTLQGYMIAKFNRGYLAAKQGARDIREAETIPQKFGATADMATNLMLIYVAESVMMGLIYAALADDDDDLDGEKFAGWLAEETVGAVIGGLPVIRDGWSMFSNPAASSGGVYGSLTELPFRVWQQAVQGENDVALRRAVTDAVGTGTGIPTTAMMRAVEEVIAGDDGSIVKALMGRNPLSN